MKGVSICRSINYWITDAEWPDIGGGEEFFTEAYEVIRNVLCNISDIFTLVSLTGKVFVACWGYYWCVLWNPSSTSHVIPWFKWDGSFMYPVEVRVWAHVCMWKCVCVCVCAHASAHAARDCFHIWDLQRSLKNVFVWGEWSLQPCKQVFIT